MPLNRYGVVIGSLNRFERDNAHHFGAYFHGKAYVDTPAGEYECAIDFSSPSGVEVRFRVVRRLNAALFLPIMKFEDGYHSLLRTPTSGALDYIRSPLFGAWEDNPGTGGLKILEMLLPQSERLFVFGEPYRKHRRHGMHNIHYNQGDLPGPHRDECGIWQDGGTIMQQIDGELIAFLTRFASQSLVTDENGLPI
jgi:Uncharacterized conserved protein (DUF2278)